MAMPVVVWLGTAHGNRPDVSNTLNTLLPDGRGIMVPVTKKWTQAAVGHSVPLYVGNEFRCQPNVKRAIDGPPRKGSRLSDLREARVATVSRCIGCYIATLRALFLNWAPPDD